MVLKTLKAPLTVAILSSTLFAVAAHAGDVTVTPTAGPLDTTTDQDITVKVGGQITQTNQPAVIINSANTLTIDANNANINSAVETTGVSLDAGGKLALPGVVAVIDGGETSSVIVGSGSGITAAGASNAISVQLEGKTGFTVDNTGTITGGANRAGIALNNVLGPTIINRANGTITGPQQGIFIDDANGVVTNYGIQNAGSILQTGVGGANSAAIYNSGNSTGVIENSLLIQSDGTNAASSALLFAGGGHVISITNNATGTIQSTNSMGITFDATTANNEITIANAGTIKADTNAIHLLGTTDFTKTSTITNSGTLTATNGYGINIGANFKGDVTNNGTMTTGMSGIRNAGASTLNIVNSGTITSTNNGAFGAIENSGALTGNITNSGTLTGSGTLMNAFRLGGTVAGDVLNSGTATTDDFFTVNITGTLTGDFTNTGTLSQTNAAAGSGAVLLDLGGGGIVGKFDNQGTITSAGPGVPAVSIEAPITMGFFNSGTITGAGPNPIAIDMVTNPPPGPVDFTQTGGTITGDIYGHNLGNVMNLSGGTIDGTIFLGNGADVVNVQNTTITGKIIGDSDNDTLNILDDFSTNNEINDILNIEVQNAGTLFTANHKIGDISNGGLIKTNVGTTFLFDTGSDLTTPGAITFYNDGTTLIADGVNIDIANSALTNDGIFGVSDTATFKVQTINNSIPGFGIGNYGFQATDNTKVGQINLDGVVAGDSDVTGDTITMVLTGDGFIQNGDAFTVITNNPGITITGSDAVVIETLVGTDPLNLDGRGSQTISFVNANGVPANNVTLTAVRTPFQGVAESVNALAVGSTLDLLINDPALHPDIKSAIGQLDVQSTKGEVTSALESLTPDVNGGLVEVSQGMHTKIVDTVIGRLEDAKAIADIVKAIQSGDEPYYGMGVWGKVFAARLSQKEIGGVEGYRAAYAGFATGFDKLFSRELNAGVALGYTMGDVDGKSKSPTDVDISSFQIAGYGSYDFPGAWYMDGVLSAGLNRYKQTREIEIGTFRRTAKADYRAWQYSGRLQAGYQMAYEKYRITPIFGASIGMLDIDSYTEATAGGVSLAVEPENVMEAIGTVGVRFLSLNEYVEALYVPEFRVMFHYDFIRDRQQATSNFVSNGTPYFNTIGAKPSPLTCNIGTALTAYGEKLIFSINYDLEIKQQYIGHYGHLKLRYEW